MTIFTESLYYGYGAMVMLATACLFTVVYLLRKNVPAENRDYMDPLPFWLRIVWPVVEVIAYYVCSNFNVRYLHRVEQRMQQNGAGYLMLAEQFLAVRLLSGVLWGVASLFAGMVVEDFHYIWVLLAVVFGFFIPELWLRDLRKRREVAVVRTLPVYLDFITLSVEAGLNFQGGIAQAVEKGPKGILRNEFNTVLRDIRSGVTRADALRRMDERLAIPEVTSFISAVIQAERMGSGMGEVLRVQAEQRRNERFQHAEKKAMEAPVKLIGPLVLFIFPVTFIVLAFPIVVKLFLEGVI